MSQSKASWPRSQAMRFTLLGLLLVGFTGLFYVSLAPAQTPEGQAPSSGPDAPVDPATANVMQGASLADENPEAGESTADHRMFAALQVDFQSGPEVTAACLTCHSKASQQIMQTSHWTWICPRARRELEERQNRAVGKGEHVINNFCIALGSNEPRCTSCHAGYGWKDKTFDFNNETLVDCLVCHDTTKTYKKFPTAAGHPVYAKDFPEGREWPKGSGKKWKPVDLKHVAMNVGKPSRHNCGTCHFFGGGGEGVKHGDMDVALAQPPRSLDVHMHAEGIDFKCTECHTTRAHQISGRCFTIPAVEQRQFVIRGQKQETHLLACESCHGPTPHRDAKLNDHTDKVSCQACHVPTMARLRPTKMWWDWSKAGRKTEDGKPIVTKEALGDAKVPTYDTKKGEFIWALDAAPEYIWFNGNMTHTFIGDKIDDQTPASQVPGVTKGRFDHLDMSKPIVRINTPQGEYGDANSRIWPVKIHRGKQVYDTQRKVLAVPQLFPNGPTKAEAYWKSYDWQRALHAGMDYIGEEYSGEYGWVQTQMALAVGAHGGAEAEDALQCNRLPRHRKGRLASLGGFYMPGRDRHAALDMVGWGLIALTLARWGGSRTAAYHPRQRRHRMKRVMVFTSDSSGSGTGCRPR
jgi:octaheme c-type cytochrome (tetrathionate reductase family)